MSNARVGDIHIPLRKIARIRSLTRKGGLCDLAINSLTDSSNIEREVEV